MSFDKQLWRQEYPFASRRLNLDGIHLHYVEEGQGEPLLLVHGNPTWSFYWRSLISAQRSRRRVVAVDHIGCGLSDKPQNYPYRLDQHIENLLRLIDSLDLREATLIAHDWGGPIGLGAAMRRPERFSRLVLLNTGAFPPPFCPLRIRVCKTPGMGEWGMRGLNLFARAATWMALENPRRLTKAAKQGLLAPYDSWQSRVAIDRFVKDIPLSPRHPTWSTLVEIERSLSQWAALPVLLIWGMKDWCFRAECLDRLLASLPHAEAHRLQDVGHYVMEEAPETVARLVEEFLACHPLSAHR